MGNRQPGAALPPRHGNEHTAFACFCISDHEHQEFSKFDEEESEWEDEVIPTGHNNSVNESTHAPLVSADLPPLAIPAPLADCDARPARPSPLSRVPLSPLEEEKPEDIDGENEEEPDLSDESVLTSVSPTKDRLSRRPNPLSLTHPSATDLPANQADSPLTATVQSASPCSVLKELQARDIPAADLVWKETGYTLLHAAVQAERPDLLELALSLGVDALAKDHLGRTALQLAYLSGQEAMAQRLVQYLDSSRTETPRSPIALSSRTDSFWMLSDPVDLSTHSETPPPSHSSVAPLPGSEEDDQHDDAHHHVAPRPNHPPAPRLFHPLPREGERDERRAKGLKKDKKAPNLTRLVGKALSKARKITLRSTWRTSTQVDRQPEG